ncbi:MAG: helix-turn-helix domain-containing protein [Peptostreptococcaceae bacterium]|jgi:transcriptional regulator with XRE-family HTH domain|nr:helix-turn-helix domain-containing protein [Peptostreptococcaceae bacterium]
MLSEKMKLLRKELSLTQAELAEKLNITRSALSLYELGKRQPDFETLNKIADFFEVSTDYLLDRTNIKTNTLETKETIAAHHDGAWTEDELAEIEKFKEFIKSKRNDQ